MMALHVGLRRSPAPAAIVGFSGAVVLEEGQGPESLKLAGRARSRRFSWCTATGTSVIPVDSLFLSTRRLAAAEVPCQWHLSLGVGHGIDGEALRQGGLFLAQSFGLPYPRAATPVRGGRP